MVDGALDWASAERVVTVVLSFRIMAGVSEGSSTIVAMRV